MGELQVVGEEVLPTVAFLAQMAPIHLVRVLDVLFVVIYVIFTSFEGFSANFTPIRILPGVSDLVSFQR